MLNRFKIISIFILVLCGSIAYSSGTANAVNGGDFRAGNIMDDSVLFDSSSIDVQTIQTFLNSKVPSCDTGGNKQHSSGLRRSVYGTNSGYTPPYTCLRDYAMDTPSMGAESGLCNPYSGGQKTASQIIYDVGKACGVSPKVLLVLLQKEQGLISDEWPWSVQYTKATGYGCPDSPLPASVDANQNGCYDEYEGFFKQIYYGARQYKKYARDASSFNYRAGRTQYIGYNPTASCGGSNVYIQNQATAGLYNYTPYQPNSATLAVGLGVTAPCGAYGNKNFWWYFTDWFGSTNATPQKCDSRVADVVCVWRLKSATGNEFLTTSISERDAALQSNKWFYITTDFYAFDKQVVGSIPVFRFMLSSGKHFYTTNTSERDALIGNSSNIFEGTVFYVYPDTTSSNIAYPVYRAYSSEFGHTFTTSPNTNSGFTNEGMRFYTPSGAASTTAAPSGRNNVYRLVSKNGQNHFYTSSLVERDRAIFVSGYIYEGVSINVSINSTGAAVYRLYNSSTGDHYYTTSSIEKDLIINNSAWASDGIVFYVDGSVPTIYQLNNPTKGGHLYTASLSEAISVSNVGGWKYEKVAFGGNPQASTTPLYRINSQNLGHFLTISIDEVLMNVNTNGWKYEGIALNANTLPTSSPVYRLYNNSTREHFYTTNSLEKDSIIGSGAWVYEGIAYYSSTTITSQPVYRLVNKLSPFRHFYTTNSLEKDSIIGSGAWVYEGIAWYN